MTTAVDWDIKPQPIKFNNTGAQLLYSIYHMALKSRFLALKGKDFAIKYIKVFMDLIT